MKGWQQNKNKLLEQQGLGGLSNREYGDKAEDYVLKRVKQLQPDYKPVKSNNSESPADIFAVTYRNWFWHIMLIQVKSSKKEETIEQLNSEQEKVFNELAKYLKKQIKESKLTKAYADKPVIISTGYTGVKRTKTTAGKLNHKLAEAKLLNYFKLNGGDLNTDRVKRMIASAHSLSL